MYLHYAEIYQSIDFYQYLVLYSITIINYDYRRKIKNRKQNKTKQNWFCILFCLPPKRSLQIFRHTQISAFSMICPKNNIEKFE